MISITRWFDKNDPYFANPFAALKAGYSANLLFIEYQRVFGDKATERYCEDHVNYCMAQK